MSNQHEAKENTELKNQQISGNSSNIELHKAIYTSSNITEKSLKKNDSNNESIQENIVPASNFNFVETPQIITWTMLIIGWVITLTLYKKNKKNSANQKLNDYHDGYIKELRELLFAIEENSIGYWTSSPDDKDQIILLRFQREIKELTSKAREIERVKGVAYQAKLFTKLRQYVTLDNDERPLKHNSSRINELRTIVSEISRSYTRKSQC
ncbi:hypothetical protein K8B83_00995 [Shewanella inventionis]|uniref:hypothetical protein n=1 Tax=Shewanella inventionis TaxID=1738770 RepID=UPI001CBF16AC|nr:hypothetical protein [Shewanella inventionis]UAL43504.1 hypothetical protein K8B83_00995 [Shewanella inventionis]